jgi:hypothetical protein
MLCYSDAGILELTNGPLRFSSIKEERTIVLCDKPECLHEGLSSRNPNPTCLAQPRNMRNALVFNNHQILIIQSEENPLIMKIYAADMSGRNRNLIAEIQTTSIYEVVIHENLIALVCDFSYYIDDIGLLVKKNNNVINLVVVNIDTGETWITPEKDGDNIVIWSPYIYNGNVYYVLYNYFENPFETYANAYMYDLKESSETIIYTIYDNSQGWIAAFTGKHLVISESNKITISSLNNSNIIQIDIPKDSLEGAVGNFRPLKSICELYFSVWRESGSTYYKFDGYSLKRINALPVSYLIHYVLDDSVFFFDEKNLYYGYMSKVDFDLGVFENSKKLFYPSEPWNER